jgi:predicted membrane protein
VHGFSSFLFISQADALLYMKLSILIGYSCLLLPQTQIRSPSLLNREKEILQHMDLTTDRQNTLHNDNYMYSHFKVDDVSVLEPSSKPPIRIVEDNVTASLHQQRTP